MTAESAKRRRLPAGGGDGATSKASPGGEEVEVEESEEAEGVRQFALEDTMLKVLHIVGKGHHVFVAAVSKDWRRVYSAAYPGLETALRRSVLGSVACLNWAITQGCPLTVDTFRAAAWWGDVSACEVLHRNGCAWDEDVCAAAARNAKHGLSILKWLRSGNLPDRGPCPWNETTCGEAAQRGDVDMLTWLLLDEANAPFDASVWVWAAQEGHVNVLQMLLTHPRVRPELEAAEGDSEWRWGAMWASTRGHLEVLRWLHANARDLCDWDEMVCEVAVEAAKSLTVLQWLRSESVVCPWGALSCPEVLLKVGAWEAGRNVTFEEMKQWVHANGHPCDCED